MRLIDADALETFLIETIARMMVTKRWLRRDKDNEDEILNVIREAPTIEAEPVVHCKDCRKRRSRECPMCDYEELWDDDEGWIDAYRDRTEDEGYCHMGTKRNGKDIDVPGKICPATKLPCCDCVPGTPCAKMDGGAEK